MDKHNAIFFADVMTESEGITWYVVDTANAKHEAGGFRVGTKASLAGWFSDCPVVHTGRRFVNA